MFQALRLWQENVMKAERGFLWGCGAGGWLRLHHKTEEESKEERNSHALEAQDSESRH